LVPQTAAKERKTAESHKIAPRWRKAWAETDIEACDCHRNL